MKSFSSLISLFFKKEINNLDNNTIVVNLWVYTSLFYLFRSIFFPLQYLAYFLFGLLTLFYSAQAIRNYKTLNLIDFLKYTKEYIVLSLLIVWGILISVGSAYAPLKELLNFVVVLFLVFVLFQIYKDIDWRRILKLWLLFSAIIGTIAIVNWLNSILSLNYEVFTDFNTNKIALSSIALTPDYNFYSLFFILSIILLFYALYSGILVHRFFFSQSILWVYILNIVLSNSRRGILVLVILILVGIIYVLISKNKLGSIKLFYKNITFPIITIFILFATILLLFPFRTTLITKEKTRNKITLPVFRYISLYNNNMPYVVVKEKLWPQHSKYTNNIINWEDYAPSNTDHLEKKTNSFIWDIEEYWSNYQDKSFPENLIYNGNFSNGLFFWDKILSKEDSVSHSLIETEFGTALRVHRIKGEGYWPLAYKGRSIIYYENITYTFKFKFRIVNGEESVFNIGWWIKDNGNNVYNLHKEIRKINSDWFECICSHTFRDTYHGEFATFMNSQKAGSVIDFADIQLFSNDTLSKPKYIDQLPQLNKGVNILYNGDFSYGKKFWGYQANDTIVQELIETPYGKGIRIVRKEGFGYWPLTYKGRDIYYQQGQTYTFRFLYRIGKGEGRPFNIGWGMIDGSTNITSSPIQSFPLSNGWNKGIASYTFKNNHFEDVPTFMNSQKANTIIEFAQIELLSTDSLLETTFVDQNITEFINKESERIQNILANDSTNYLSDSRTSRWHYGLDLFNAYSHKNKIFGDGFNYIYLFDKKFVHTNLTIEEIRTKGYFDYPHNHIISTFLYSGIIGGIFYIYFLILSFWYYWKYRKQHLIFLFMYLVTFFFVFFSGNSPISVPIFTVLSFVPFLTRYFVENKLKV